MPHSVGTNGVLEPEGSRGKLHEDGKLPVKSGPVFQTRHISFLKHLLIGSRHACRYRAPQGHN